MKILLVDDHPLFREAIKSVLEAVADDRLDVIEASSCEDALQLCQHHEDCDLLVLDLELPGIDGLTGLSHFRELLPAIPIVIVSAAENRSQVMEAIEQGAKGFIPKSSSREVMINALRLVLAGGVYLPMAVMDVPLSNGFGRKTVTASSVTSLTPRQLDVLQLMAKGKMNKEIGNGLGMAENTVRVHVRAILNDLGVSNRTEACYAAVQLGLITEDLN